MKKFFIIFSFIVALFISGYFYFMEEIVLRTSVLNNQTFKPKVLEVMSPQTNIKSYLFEENSNPIVAINIMFLSAGSSQNKISYFLSDVLVDDKKIQEEFELNGISITYSTGIDDFGIYINTPKKNLDTAIKLFNKTFYNPQIKDASVEKRKQELLTELEMMQENPNIILSLAFSKAMYGKHPYGQNPLGTKEQILAFNKDDILSYLKTAFGKDNLLISIAGDVNQEEATKIVDELFANLPEKSALTLVHKAHKNKVDEVLKKEIPQNIVVMETNGVRRSDADFYPLYIANYILGGSSLNSKLSKEIREKHGLVYSINSYLLTYDKAQSVMFNLSTSKDNYNKAMSLFADVITNFEVEQRELNETKKSLIDSHNLRFDSTSEVAEFLTYIQKDNLGIDFFEKRNQYIKDVDLPQVNNAIKKYFNYKNFNKMTIGE